MGVYSNLKGWRGRTAGPAWGGAGFATDLPQSKSNSGPSSPVCSLRMWSPRCLALKFYDSTWSPHNLTTYELDASEDKGICVTLLLSPK